MPEFHAEPYLHLAGLSHKSALITWGAFYFQTRTRHEWKLVDDQDLRHVHPPRRESIGARSDPYGPARVNVYDMAGTLAATSFTETTNFCWLAGLVPDTRYRYEVIVKDEMWAEGERWDWTPGATQGLVQQGRRYVNEFRTHPDPVVEPAGTFTFMVLGDYGTGIRKSTATRRQREVAEAMQRAFDQHDVRLIITAGDNIYAGNRILGLPVGAQGDEDDDWFFTFFQPYRYMINRVPVYPASATTMARRVKTATTASSSSTICTCASGSTVRAIGELADGEVRDLPRLTQDGQLVHAPMAVRR